MRLLLDTQVVLWALQDAKALGAHIRERLAAAEVIYVSAASVAEMLIKAEQGKVSLPEGLAAALARSGFSELAVSWEQTAALRELRSSPADLIDRLLIAQAQVEQLVLVTADPELLKAYPGLCLDGRR